jgi:hypothetical protein
MEAVRTHQVLRDEEAPRAGVDRSRLLFKVVQAWFKVNLGAFKAGSNRFDNREREDLRYVATPRLPQDEEDHGTYRLQPKEASVRVKAQQAQTLRFFRLLRLLGPPQSSKPQRLLAASELGPTLATDSVLGARRQLPSRSDTTKWVDLNSHDALTANLEERVSNCICLHCLLLNPSAPLIDREACRGSRKARKLMGTSFSSAQFPHQKSYPSRSHSTPVRTALTSRKARTRHP